MKNVFALFFLLFSQFGFAQESIQSRVDLPETGLKASYLGSIIYPGFKIGIERPYKVIQVEKQKSWGVKTYLKERYWTLNLGFYNHPTFHDNLYLLAEWQLRRQKSSGWFFEFAPGIGYSRTFLGGATYKVADNGEVSKVSAAGYGYAMFSIAGGFGYDFMQKSEVPVKAFFKPSLFFMTPSNSFVYIRPTVEIGIIYSPPKFFKANPSVKIRKK
jgi:hypothetical protein